MFRYKNSDLFPFPCPRCGEHIEKAVGWLKANTKWPCPECKANIWYSPETLLRALDESEQAINNFSRDVGFNDQGT